MSKDAKKLSSRNANRSRTPQSEQFMKYIGSGWADNKSPLPKADPVAPFAAKRRAAVAKAFKGKVVVIAAGDMKQRSNDTDYRFRPHSAFAHLTGWGSRTVPASVLVIDARTGNKSTLFLRETAGHDTDEFFANSAIGEFWVGSRPSLKQVSSLLGLQTKSLKTYDEYMKSISKRVVVTLDDANVAEFVSELRLVKDEYEIKEMRKAIAASIEGFKSVVSNLDRAIKHPRGERIVEGAFFAEARANGNELGYDTIAAAGEHACTLHWIINDGKVNKGELLLLDAGVEVDSLYTADITRTLPINGKFNATQEMIYEAVREAADAAFKIAKPGVKFREIHAAAMKVIAQKTAEWGLLPVSAEESLEPDNQFHRRWMIHGTSHHLGLDVHDCAQARREMYIEAELKPGMIFTIEPGLYFHKDDLLVPKKFRGIGARIEDDVLVTATGVENLTKALPRKARDVEAWMKSLR
jgi:Xaa-Pro aminopeptidase